MYVYRYGAWCAHIFVVVKLPKIYLQKVKLVPETPAALFVKRDFSFQSAFGSHSTVFSVFLMDVLKVCLPSDQGCISMRVGDTGPRL